MCTGRFSSQIHVLFPLQFWTFLYFTILSLSFPTTCHAAEDRLEPWIDQGEAGGPQASGLENHTLLIPSPPESCLSHQVPFWFTIQSPSPSGTSAPHLSLTSTCSGMHERLNTWTMCIHRHVPRPVYICSYGGVDFQKSFPYHSRSQPLGHWLFLCIFLHCMKFLPCPVITQSKSKIYKTAKKGMCTHVHVHTHWCKNPHA